MKLPIEWLNDFINTPDEKTLAQASTQAGLNVEEQVDGVLDIEVTPNRGDCLSIIGIAREIAAQTNQEIKQKDFSVKEGSETGKINIKIPDKSVLDRYTCRLIKNISVKPSSEKIQERLKKYGIKPINNIVDITNYVMIETGQPLHAFDYDKINNGIMQVRKSNAGERLKTLDGKENTLPENTIIIEDDQKIYDLAGIMGGENSEISENTKNIILQSSSFNPLLIRRVSRKLQISTEASYRFERGIDIEMCLKNLDYATYLISESCNAEIYKVIDQYPAKIVMSKLEVESKDVERLIGINVSQEEITKFLHLLGFEKCDNTCYIVPSWRVSDVKNKADIIEEIAKVYSYNKLPKEILSKRSPQAQDNDYYHTESLKDALVSLGLTETYNYSYLSKEDFRRANLSLEDTQLIENPISNLTEVLRSSLLPGLLKDIYNNQSFDDYGLFEIGRVFDKNSERTNLAIVLLGKSRKLENNIKEKINEIFKQKGIIDFQTVDSKILNNFKIKKNNISFAELKITNIIEEVKLGKPNKIIKAKRVKYKPISNFPSATRDLAFIIKSNVDADKLSEEITNIDPLITSCELFDEFKSPKFGTDNKNVAYHLILESTTKTLTENEIKDIINKVVSHLKNKYSAKLREF